MFLQHVLTHAAAQKLNRCHSLGHWITIPVTVTVTVTFTVTVFRDFSHVASLTVSFTLVIIINLNLAQQHIFILYTLSPKKKFLRY